MMTSVAVRGRKERRWPFTAVVLITLAVVATMWLADRFLPFDPILPRDGMSTPKPPRDPGSNPFLADLLNESTSWEFLTEAMGGAQLSGRRQGIRVLDSLAIAITGESQAGIPGCRVRRRLANWNGASPCPHRGPVGWAGGTVATG